MTCDPNDPRLTAFVLGELDPDDRAAVETMLGDSAECRQAVEEIRLTVRWLTKQLHDESESHLQPVGINHQIVADGLSQPAIAARPWWRRNRVKLLGLAASVSGCGLGRVSVNRPARAADELERARARRPRRPCSG